MNQTRYETTLETGINDQRSSDLFVNARLSQLAASLHKDAKAAVPSKITKLKDPRGKLPQLSEFYSRTVKRNINIG